MYWIIYYIPIAVLFLIAYLIGSIPFGLVLTKMFKGVDLREIGSKNIGTTNVLRTGNKLLAFVTLLLDMGKGYISAFLHLVFLNLIKSATDPDPILYIHYAIILGFGAILGHCFPIWLKFKGGKGVATTLGVLLAAVPYSGLIAIATWLVVAFTTRYSSLSALCAVAIAPIATFFIYGSMPAALCFLISALVWARHKENIKRLLAGKESKIGGSKG
jgi:glycerol-3-phosphate acyltransferase PlsY